MKDQKAQPVVREKRLGDKVRVRHRSVLNKAELAEIKACSKSDWDESCVITAIYMDGKVRLNTGDVWDVKAAGGGKVQWETVAMADT